MGGIGSVEYEGRMRWVENGDRPKMLTGFAYCTVVWTQVTFTQALLVEVWEVSAEGMSFENKFEGIRGNWPLKEMVVGQRFIYLFLLSNKGL